MDYKEAIRLIQQMLKDNDEDGGVEFGKRDKEALSLAVSALEERRKDGWIPVEEALPEKAGEYLVTSRWDETEDFRTSILEYGFKVESDWDGSERVLKNGAAFGEDWNGEMDNIEETIAWRPLPAPFQKEDEDGNKVHKLHLC